MRSFWAAARYCVTASLIGFPMAGCGHTSAVESRFSAEYGCNDVSVRELGGNAFLASGCGESATYTCVSSDDPGWGKLAPESTCTREQSVARRMRRAPPSRAGRGQDVAGPDAAGRVSRHYDEQRKLQIVRADFEVERGVRLTLLGAPEAELGDVLVQIQAPAYALRSETCGSLEILVNAVPAGGSEFATTAQAQRVSVHAHFQFEQFKPLAKKYPTFGARLCRRKLELSERAVAQVQKFLVIYSELATEVQQKQAQEQPPAEAPDAGPPLAPSTVSM
jgi:hypothetical protein